ncbi:MAG: response regulator, partial [Chloroflexota bacterium]
LSRIFDPFFSTKSHGKGLGLSSTLGIITSHDGTLQVESEEGQGTTFTVYLPLYTSHHTLSIIEYENDYSDLEEFNLLVIDDESAVRDAVIDLCQTQNIVVYEAPSGREGINFYARYHHKIDLILLDIQMPGMNGIEAWHALKQINPDARIILSSGFINDELKQNLPEGPFLAKPWSSDELLSKLQYSIKQSA